MDELTSFTPKQRAWVLRRDSQQCTFHFPILTVGGIGIWVRCKNTKSGLQVHHLVPRGYSMLWMPKNFAANGPMNLGTMCDGHHVGKMADGDYKFVLHPDVEETRLAYARGNRNAFLEMMARRKELNAKGIPYWNCQFDGYLKHWVKMRTLTYISQHRDDPYPDGGVRGRTGRLEVAK